MKFQDKFYDIIDHNKCPSSEKSAEKCILRKSFFHHSEPKHVEFGIKILDFFSKIGVYQLYCVRSNPKLCTMQEIFATNSILKLV